MKIIFTDLDRPLRLLNSRYECETQDILYFVKHHSLTIYIYVYIYSLSIVLPVAFRSKHYQSKFYFFMLKILI
jgi:hypothetical protein